MLSSCGAGGDSWEFLGLQGDQTSHQGNQPGIFTERTDAKAEAPILQPPDAKSRFIEKDPDTGKDKRQKKERAENEMLR